MHKSQHQQQGAAVLEDGQHVPEKPAYWKRAHHDWRFWVGFFLMLVAITTYFMSDDLSMVPSAQPRPPASDSTGK